MNRRSYIFLIILAVASLGVSLLQVPVLIKQHNEASDLQKVDDLESIKSAIDVSYSKNNQLPGSLQDLSSLSSDTKKRLSNYAYTASSKTRYELCASFGVEASKQSGATSYYSYDEEKAKIATHTSGRQCFDFSVNSRSDSLYDSYYNYPSSTSLTKDAKTQTTINSVTNDLEAFFADKGFYPTKVQLASDVWRNDNKLEIESGTLSSLDYVYTTAPSNCDNSSIDCTSYTLSAELSSGIPYTKSSAN